MPKQAIFIIRGFNKSEQDFLDWEQRFAVIRTTCESHNIATHVIYSTPDTNPEISQLTTPITVIQAGSDNAVRPSWSTGLNIPIGQLLQDTPEADYKNTYIIPISFETTLDENNAELMAKTISEDKRFIACRITPDWLNENNPYSIATQEDILQRWEYVKTNIQHESLSNIMREEKRLQALCMFGRNTLAQYYLSDFAEHGLFDETTDALGGMEDWEYLLRMANTISKFEQVVFYTDTRIREDEPSPEVQQKQREKLNREIGALKKIIEQKL